MKPHAGYTLPILVIVVNMALANKQSKDDYKYEYYGDYDYHSDGSDTAPSNQQQVAPSVIQCYSCHYHVRAGEPVGSPGCKDTFRSLEIPAVPCPGQCGKAYHKISEVDFLISRNCMYNCKDYQSEEGYTVCCTGDLCNAATSSLRTGGAGLLILAVLTTLYTLR